MNTLILWLAACQPPSPSAPAGASTVRFELDSAPPDWGSVPFPSDLYRDADGRFAMGALPNPLDGTPLFDALRVTLADRGACTTCASHAFVDGGLDPATLEAGVHLVDLDSGIEHPLTVQWDPSTERLSVRPERGHVLARGTRHALVLTSDLTGTDGLPVGASADFRTLVAARDPRLEPTLLALEPKGFDRAHIVGLAPFTTGDPTRSLAAIAAQVDDAAPAVVRVDRVWTGSELDDLLGEPAEDRPGVDVPPLSEGARSVRHATTLVAVTGTFSAPRFVQGAGSDVGPVGRDAEGLPAVTGADDVPFLLLVPRGADLAHLPVAVVHHGFNASRTTGFVLADTLGDVGMAVLAIDGFQHGDRAASAADVRNSMRDLDGPDGFAETVELDVSGRMFGVLGAEPGLAFAADLPLAAFLQLAADALSAVRLAREGDLDGLRAAAPELGDLAFDPDRVAFVGNSMGAVVGTSVVTASSELGTAVLNVLPGSIVDTLVESGEFRGLTDTALLGPIGVTGAFDEQTLSLALDPTVDLYRWALEPVDPLALAPSLAGRNVLVQLAGHDEVAAPGPSQAVVSAAGLPGVGTFELASVPEATGPTEGVVWRYDPAMHGMLEVQVQTSHYEDPLLQPLESRPDAVDVVNPIEAVHAQIGAWMARFVEDGVGRLE